MQPSTDRPPLDASEVLKRLREKLPQLAQTIEPASRLDQLTIDSLDLVEMLCAVESEFHVRLSDEDMRSLGTVGDLARLVAGRVAGRSGGPGSSGAKERG